MMPTGMRPRSCQFNVLLGVTTLPGVAYRTPAYRDASILCFTFLLHHIICRVDRLPSSRLAIDPRWDRGRISPESFLGLSSLLL
jgi:hypothetical protein